jgi:hypothetical protein
MRQQVQICPAPCIDSHVSDLVAIVAIPTVCLGYFAHTLCSGLQGLPGLCLGFALKTKVKGVQFMYLLGLLQ